GLNLTSGLAAFGGAMGALAVYAVGKTFFWPTMLAVASDRFPRTGAVAISIMGGLGMMSAGLVGSPGLGYAKDRFASAELERANSAVYTQYKVTEPKGWLFFGKVYAIDGKKLGDAQHKLASTGRNWPKPASPIRKPRWQNSRPKSEPSSTRASRATARRWSPTR